MAILPPFKDEDLHQQILEAIKRFQVAKDAHAHALGVIENQYLTPLTHTPASDQADAVRKLLTA